ncbi:MAG TPA: NAD(P)-binding domain-containing protein, partial [Polyangiaceae bacterium]|nr:NAD(P)-binding domain-containing protein [Polyangiaceae bacterium]
ARVADDPAAAVAASDATVLCVHDYRASRAILAHAGVAEALRGKLLVDLSTGSPEDARAQQAWARERGADYLDGAIQAAPEQMGRPDTTILVSGAPEAFRRGEARLRAFGGNVKHLGPAPGAAAAMDAATLSYVYGSFLGFLYGARFAEAEGFGVDDYGRIVAEIAPGFGAFLAHEGAVIARGDYAPSQSPMSISIEATARLAAMARENGLSSELPELVAGLFAKAARAGYAGEEAAALVKVLRTLALRVGYRPASAPRSPGSRRKRTPLPGRVRI